MKKIAVLSLVCLIVMIAGIIVPSVAEGFSSRSFSTNSTFVFSSGSRGIARSSAGTTTTIPAPRPTPPPPAPEPEPDPEPPTPSPSPSPGTSRTYSSGAHGVARSGSTNTGFYTPPSTPAPPPPAPEPEPEPEPDPEPPPSSYQPEVAQERLLLDLVNQERASRGLEPLILHSGLTQTARMKSIDMIEHNYFAHNSPTYGSSGDMIRAAGIGFRLAAENIGMGGNVRTIFNAFMSSPAHRNKIIGSAYTHTGIGIYYKAGRGYIITQHFIQAR